VPGTVLNVEQLVMPAVPMLSVLEQLFFRALSRPLPLAVAVAVALCREPGGEERAREREGG
jgi:hypothetical protein